MPVGARVLNERLFKPPGHPFVWHDARVSGRGAVDELTFLLVRVAVVAVPTGLGYAVAGTPGLAVGLVAGLVAGGVFWSWTTATGARAAARSALPEDAADRRTDDPQVEGGSGPVSGR